MNKIMFVCTYRNDEQRSYGDVRARLVLLTTRQTVDNKGRGNEASAVVWRRWLLQGVYITDLHKLLDCALDAAIFICSRNLEQSRVYRKSQYVTASRCIPAPDYAV